MERVKSWPGGQEFLEKMKGLVSESSLVQHEIPGAIEFGGMSHGYELMIKYLPKAYLLIQIDFSTFSKAPSFIKDIREKLTTEFGLEACCRFKTSRRIIQGIYPGWVPPEEKFLMMEYHTNPKRWYQSRKDQSKTGELKMWDLKKLFLGK